MYKRLTNTCYSSTDYPTVPDRCRYDGLCGRYNIIEEIRAEMTEDDLITSTTMVPSAVMWFSKEALSVEAA